MDPSSHNLYLMSRDIYLARSLKNKDLVVKYLFVNNLARERCPAAIVKENACFWRSMFFFAQNLGCNAVSKGSVLG